MRAILEAMHKEVMLLQFKLDKAALSGVYQLRVGTKGQDGVLAIKDGKYVIQKRLQFQICKVLYGV